MSETPKRDSRITNSGGDVVAYLGVRQKVTRLSVSTGTPLPDRVISLEDYFENNSSFRFLKSNPPQYFLDLQPILEPRTRGLTHPEMDRLIALAANTCRRLADICVVAYDIQQALKKPWDGQNVILGTRLVWFFGSCKALLDAGSIALSSIYSLQASNGTLLDLKKQDFGKSHFRNVLKTQIPNVELRYQGFYKTFDEIVTWRDAAVHRITPLVIVTLARHPGTTRADFHEYHVVLDPNASAGELFTQKTDSGPVNYHYERWRKDLDGFCSALCHDIRLAAGHPSEDLNVPDV